MKAFTLPIIFIFFFLSGNIAFSAEKKCSKAFKNTSETQKIDELRMLISQNANEAKSNNMNERFELANLLEKMVMRLVHSSANTSSMDRADIKMIINDLKTSIAFRAHENSHLPYSMFISFLRSELKAEYHQMLRDMSYPVDLPTYKEANTVFVHYNRLTETYGHDVAIKKLSKQTKLNPETIETMLLWTKAEYVKTEETNKEDSELSKRDSEGKENDGLASLSTKANQAFNEELYSTKLIQESERKLIDALEANQKLTKFERYLVVASFRLMLIGENKLENYFISKNLPFDQGLVGKNLVIKIKSWLREFGPTIESGLSTSQIDLGKNRLIGNALIRKLDLDSYTRDFDYLLPPLESSLVGREYFQESIVTKNSKQDSAKKKASEVTRSSEQPIDNVITREKTEIKEQVSKETNSSFRLSLSEKPERSSLDTLDNKNTLLARLDNAIKNSRKNDKEDTFVALILLDVVEGMKDFDFNTTHSIYRKELEDRFRREFGKKYYSMNEQITKDNFLDANSRKSRIQKLKSHKVSKKNSLIAWYFKNIGG